MKFYFIWMVLAWIPIDVHLIQIVVGRPDVSTDLSVAHVARVGAVVEMKQVAVISGVRLNPAPEGAVVDRLNVGLGGEYVEGPGVVEYARLGKLLRG